MKILVGYDGSKYGDFALIDLQNAGLPDDAEALILTIGEAWELPSVMESVSPSSTGFVPPTVTLIEEHLAEIAKKTESAASAAAKKIINLFPNWKVSEETAFGKPAVEIINKADEWKPDLIVVGSQGRSAIGRFFLGSVSQKVLNESNCSVRISKSKISDNASELKILLAVDGSPNAEKAVREAANRKWKAGTQFRLVAVNDPFTRSISGYLAWDHDENQPEENDKSREWIEKVINAPMKVLQSAGLQVSETIRWGDAGNMILNEAREWDADTIFLGARGLSQFRRFLLGSVSSFVAARAECSVEIIRETV